MNESESESDSESESETESESESGGDQGTPEGHRGVHPTPWQCTKSRACHAKATGNQVCECVSDVCVMYV